MKITKLAHSCLLVEMPEPVNRTVLFDPGEMSAELVRAADLKYLDDIVITHEHFDHCNLPLVQELVGKFPQVRILGPQAVTDQLAQVGVSAAVEPAEGLIVFESPHEPLAPLGPAPQAIGVHYLDTLTHPGDSHHFSETKAILALPVTAPWGTTMNAAKLATELRPQYVIPIHDWMWKDAWRERMYAWLAGYFEVQGITFVQPVDGHAFTLDVAAR
jgi:L-ascorbate metabolism protein UlaG (beta-lactamase superfamily)